MNPKSAEQVVQEQLEYYNKHNLSRFISTYHDDIEIYNLESNTLILSGKKELEEKYRERFEVLKVNAKLMNRIVIGNKIIDHEHVTGIKLDEIVKAVAIYEVKDEKIYRVWFVYE